MSSSNFRSVLQILTFNVLTIGLFACGGGGGGTPATLAPTASPVTISGTITYTDFEVGGAGINYASPVNKPVRGAVIELQSPVGTVVATANTTETGAYSFTTAPANSTVRILVKAAIGTPASPNTSIVDNTSSGALYTLFNDVTTVTSNITQNLNAASGWGGSSYTSTRAAAPFAILDVIYQGQKMIMAADSAVVFPALNINWSVNNKPLATGQAQNLLTGDLGGSFYNPNDKGLYILGAANADTDEYDSAVIGHEWGHYFESNFSRSDSNGGEHANGDILHPSVAFGEGFGSAFGAMILNSPIYIDTSGALQADRSVETNLEEDSVADGSVKTGTGSISIKFDGYYSENSVMEVIYDIFDGGATDDDALALGFTPMYQVLIDGQKNTKSFTSIFSFLYHLKIASPSSSAAINTIAAAENIDLSDNNEFQDATDPSDLAPQYSGIADNGTVFSLDSEGKTLQTYDNFGAVTADDVGNKLLNQRFFATTISTAGCYTLSVTPTAPSDLYIQFPSNKTPSEVDKFTLGETFVKTFTTGEILTYSVGAFVPNAVFTVKVESTPGVPGC